MNREPTLDLFVEDQGHESFISAMAARIAAEKSLMPRIRPVSARGGHPRVLEELKLYQEGIRRGVVGRTLPDVLIVAIDCNCSSFSKTQRRILECVDARTLPNTVFALPDPHVERWYMADPASFRSVIGVAPPTVRRKCAKDRYKNILRQAISKAGQPVAMGGAEFAPELVQAMDLARAGSNISELGKFITDLRAALSRLATLN